MKMDVEGTDTKNLEKNTFRTSDSSDFGSHSQNMAVQEHPPSDSNKDPEFGGDVGESVPHEEVQPAAPLVGSSTSSAVTKCHSLSDNSDTCMAPCPQASKEEEEKDVSKEPIRRRL
jgi:hypothetical protein